MSTITELEEPPPRIAPRDGLAVTPEEYDRLIDDDRRYELVDGRLKEIELSAYSQVVATEIATQIRIQRGTRLDGYGVCGGRFRFHPDEPARYRLPDVAFVSHERLGGTAIPASHFDVAPELAVEAVSPTDNVFELDDKVAEYLEFGVLHVWVARPNLRVIDVYDTAGGVTRHGAGDTLAVADGPLAGLALKVADVFPPQAGRPAAARP